MGLAASQHTWPLKLTLAVVSTALTLAAVEALVRARQWVRYGSAGTTLYSTLIDPGTGLPVPVAGETTGTLRINALGFRGPEISALKPVGARRLAFVGSSTTFCAEVSSNELAWPHLTWQAVQANWPAIRFDYVNAAFPGYTTNVSRRAVLQRLPRLEPDVIVIYEGINDISRDTRQQAEQAGFAAPIDSESRGIARYSLAYRLIRKNLELIERRDLAARRGYVPQLDTLTAVFAQNLDDLVTAAQTVAPVVAVATLTQKVRPDQPLEVQHANANTHHYYMPHLSVAAVLEVYAAYNNVIRAVARNRRILLIEGEQLIPGDDRHFRDSVHFSDEGSRAMAARVAAALLADASVQALAGGVRHVRSESP
jgi:lysophospholipase L1-like esterase